MCLLPGQKSDPVIGCVRANRTSCLQINPELCSSLKNSIFVEAVIKSVWDGAWLRHEVLRQECAQFSSLPAGNYIIMLWDGSASGAGSVRRFVKSRWISYKLYG